MKERLRCIKEHKNFTLGKIYNSMDYNYETEEYEVINNDNITENIHKKFFISLDDEDLTNLLCSLGC